jgi:hypothetical protein
MMKGITNAEAIEMMYRCKHEIASLRAEIDRLAPKAHAYDSIASILRLMPQPSRGMGEDVLWVLEKRIRELTPQPAPDLGRPVPHHGSGPDNV